MSAQIESISENQFIVLALLNETQCKARSRQGKSPQKNNFNDLLLPDGYLQSMTSAGDNRTMAPLGSGLLPA
jgi:hypothetical protein